MQSSTISIPTARRTCCCSACSIRAGSSSSSPSTRPTKPDRALVEDPALLGAEGPTLRDLGRDRASRRTRNRLLERAQTSLHLGPSPASSDAPPPRPRRYSRCLKNLADAPLSIQHK